MSSKKSVKQLFLLIICLLSFGFFLSFSTAFADQTPLRIGFVPGRMPQVIIRDWNFIIRHLSSKLGRPVEMVLRENYSDIVDDFLAGKLDLFEGGTYAQSLLMAKVGLIPLVGENKFGQLTYRSAIVVKNDSPIDNVIDLKGKKMAFTDPLSASGFVLPRIMLDDQGIKDPNTFFEKIYMTGSHDRSIAMLLNDQVDAVAIGNMFINYAPAAIRKKIRILSFSNNYPHAPISCRQTLDPKLREQITQILLELNNHVPFETLRASGTDSFAILSPEQIENIRTLHASVARLPDIKFESPPSNFDFYLQNQKAHYQQMSVLYLVIPMVCILALLGLLLLYHRSGSLRRYFAVAIVLPITIFVLLVSGLELYYIINKIAQTIAVSERSFSTFKVDLIHDLNKGILPRQQVAQRFVEDNGLVTAVRIFREGKYVMDSTRLSLDKYIDDNILSNSFSLLPDKATEAEEIFDTLWFNDKIWGNTQLLLDYTPIKEAVNKIALIHFALLAFIGFFGIGLHLVLTHILKKPIDQIAQTLSQLKAREDHSNGPAQMPLHASEDNLVSIAEEISYVGQDMVEQHRFLELRHKQFFAEKEHGDPLSHGLTKELIQKILNEIDELEKKHPEFGLLRRNELLGTSPEFLKTLMEAIIRAKDNDPVLVFGPTGSGKTAVAKAVHLLSPRRQKMYGEFNCAEFASADPLVVLGKLFGYGKNSGIAGIPREGQPGLLEKFNEGTLFFDEVEVIPHQAQQLLLLPLEGKPYHVAAGEGAERFVNVRFVFASNADLLKEIQAGTMRQDFYRRINARGLITIPKLDERRGDIPLLAGHFLAQWNRANRQNLSFSETMWKKITENSYIRYNVSELKTVITVAADRALFAREKEIGDGRPLQVAPVCVDNEVAIGTNCLDATEKLELAVLRKHGFSIGPAEQELEYSAKAKTLSNHFRGLCYKLLVQKKQAGMLLNEATCELVARDLLGHENFDQELLLKITNKVFRFYQRIINTPPSLREKLKNNLPKKHEMDLATLTQYLESLK